MIGCFGGQLVAVEHDEATVQTRNRLLQELQIMEDSMDEMDFALDDTLDMLDDLWWVQDEIDRMFPVWRPSRWQGIKAALLSIFRKNRGSSKVEPIAGDYGGITAFDLICRNGHPSIAWSPANMKGRNFRY
jgi:hypothetical protein